jgi:hypothetical protein
VVVGALALQGTLVDLSRTDVAMREANGSWPKLSEDVVYCLQAHNMRYASSRKDSRLPKDLPEFWQLLESKTTKHEDWHTQEIANKEQGGDVPLTLHGSFRSCLQVLPLAGSEREAAGRVYVGSMMENNAKKAFIKGGTANAVLDGFAAITLRAKANGETITTSTYPEVYVLNTIQNAETDIHPIAGVSPDAWAKVIAHPCGEGEEDCVLDMFKFSNPEEIDASSVPSVWSSQSKKVAAIGATGLLKYQMDKFRNIAEEEVISKL